MKHVPFLVFLLASTFTFAQDYRCVLNSGEQIFSNGDYYRAIRIDSVQTFVDHTSYYQFYTLGSTDEYQECYSNHHPSWIGAHVDVYANGDHHFFNLEADTILIKTWAAAGEEWTCYTFENGDYVRGKIISHENSSFLGFTDTVKVCRFNAFDSGGNPMVHTVNGMKIRISKNYGLVQTLNFKLFPDLYDYPMYEYINEYTLVGMSNPEEGIQNLDIRDIYNFEIGDELHIYQSSSSWLQDDYYYYEIHRILGKQWVSDTILAYTVDQCTRRYYVSSDTLVLSHDTATLQVNLNSFEDAGINEMPDKVLNGNAGWENEYYWYVQHLHPEYDKIAKTFMGGYFYEEWFECIVPMIDYDYSCYYLEGLGGPYWHYGSFGSDQFRGLVYYKKGDEEWGEPYDCDSLMVHIHDLADAGMSIVVVPNPMNSQTRVEIEHLTSRYAGYRLINSMGTTVQSNTIPQNSFTIRREALPSGIYILQIVEEDRVVGHCKLILQ